MKKLMLAGAALAALVTTPALAGGGTHINVGFYTPAPVVMHPAPVYYAPVRYVYAPPVRPCPPHHARWHRHTHPRDYAWNAPHAYRGYRH